MRVSGGAIRQRQDHAAFDFGLHSLSGWRASGTLGADVSRLKPKYQSRFRREKLGFVFQRFHLFAGLNAWENVQVTLRLLGRSGRASKRESLEILEAVGLADRANYQISQLSMGQRQRVALARALVGSPELILADEPTASLDSESGQTAMNLLKTLCAEMGKTVLVVTHDSRIYHMADRILTMREGLLVPTPAEVSQPSPLHPAERQAATHAREPQIFQKVSP
jgi:putative ABC transport system ATP-binding protein